jgi:two-component system response regulator DesR
LQASIDPVILIVEDDESYVDVVVAPIFRSDWLVEIAYNIPQAHAALDAIGHPALAVVDLDLPGGQPFSPDDPGGYGFEIVARLRRECPATPVVVLTGHLIGRLVNRAHELGAEFVYKQEAERNLRLIAERMRAANTTRAREIARFVQDLGGARPLSPRQRDIVTLALRGLRNDDIALRIGISPNTLKRHIRFLLAKTGDVSLQDVVLRFLRGHMG